MLRKLWRSIIARYDNGEYKTTSIYETTVGGETEEIRYNPKYDYIHTLDKTGGTITILIANPTGAQEITITKNGMTKQEPLPIKCKLIGPGGIISYDCTKKTGQRWQQIERSAIPSPTESKLLE